MYLYIKINLGLQEEEGYMHGQCAYKNYIYKYSTYVNICIYIERKRKFPNVYHLTEGLTHTYRV